MYCPDEATTDRRDVPTIRRFCNRPCFEFRINTEFGRILVALQGNTQKPAIVTYHDLAFNYLSFETFFNHKDMQDVLDNFCVYHINAPGQEEGAAPFPEDYTYPTLDELATQIKAVQEKFGFKTFIGLGVGVGANILARFAIKEPSKVEAVVLINCTSTAPGWVDYGFFKLASTRMRRTGTCEPGLDLIMWHHFNRLNQACHKDLLIKYRNQFACLPNAGNLALYLEAFGKRQNMRLSRERGTMQVPVLNIVAGGSPYVDASINFNASLDPSKSTWMKINYCSLVLEEEPGKVAEAFRLFLQGEGYVSPIPKKKFILGSENLQSGERRSCRHSPVIRITENPISEAVAC
ncbi:protein NDRG3-like isoform X2 [Zerene cesonia]|uniref:protein NDRG3-like isoform X2 n=1 Tax=Zerene cesonia TaxID=33412 RepID=UPI0018E50547|nr:protein NDRG3-like isoform X2 [Zerene cesonia]